jgi:toxin CcdB
MAQFDLYRLASGQLVIDCQAEELSSLPTRIVVPLLDPAMVPRPVKSLHPIFVINRIERVMATHLLSAIPERELGEALQSFERYRYDIVNALDFLITGV